LMGLESDEIIPISTNLGRFKNVASLEKWATNKGNPSGYVQSMQELLKENYLKSLTNSGLIGTEKGKQLYDLIKNANSYDISAILHAEKDVNIAYNYDETIDIDDRLAVIEDLWEKRLKEME
jgi:hypothetical protein